MVKMVLTSRFRTEDFSLITQRRIDKYTFKYNYSYPWCESDVRQDDVREKPALVSHKAVRPSWISAGKQQTVQTLI